MIDYSYQGIKVAKDSAVDRAEIAENQLRDANIRVDKANEEMQALNKKYQQIKHDLETSQEEMINANVKLELKEKTLHAVIRTSQIMSNSFPVNHKRTSILSLNTGRTRNGSLVSKATAIG